MDIIRNSLIVSLIQKSVGTMKQLFVKFVFVDLGKFR